MKLNYLTIIYSFIIAKTNIKLLISFNQAII